MTSDCFVSHRSGGDRERKDTHNAAHFDGCLWSIDLLARSMCMIEFCVLRRYALRCVCGRRSIDL